MDKSGPYFNVTDTFLLTFVLPYGESLPLRICLHRNQMFNHRIYRV